MYCAIGAFKFYYNKTVYQLIIFPYFFNGLLKRFAFHTETTCKAETCSSFSLNSTKKRHQPKPMPFSYSI